MPIRASIRSYALPPRPPAVLSEISDCSLGSIFDRAVLSNIFTYAILPPLALASSQVPEIGQTFGRWLDPLNRLLETG